MTQELRKLAEAATQGEWWIDSHGMVMSQKGGRKMIFMTSERMGEPKRNPETGNLSRWPNDHDASYIAAANPAAILELIDRLERAEKDAARMDWLEQNLFNRENVDWITGKVSKTHNMWVTFAPVGVQGSARRIIDSAMEASK